MQKFGSERTHAPEEPGALNQRQTVSVAVHSLA